MGSDNELAWQQLFQRQRYMSFIALRDLAEHELFYFPVLLNIVTTFSTVIIGAGVSYL
jgi:hypothetical protein